MSFDVPTRSAQPDAALQSLPLTEICAIPCWLFVLLFGVLGSLSASASHGISAANIVVEQLDVKDTTNSVRVSLPLSINSFQIEPGSTTGDLLVRIGLSADDDEAQGVLLSSVSENGRNNFGTNNFPVSAAHASGSYRLSTWAPSAQTAGSAFEYNANLSAAWFSYSKFLGGVARNYLGLNSATNDFLQGSAGILLGTHFIQASNGVFFVNLKSLGVDSRTDGVLLVNGARDENNFALSRVNTNDGTWTVFVRDNAEPVFGTYEQDPVAFVFIPKTNSFLVSGRFNGDGTVAFHSGAAPRFTVTNLSTGRWELKIPGYYADDGVLIISAEGGGRLNGDNIVSYSKNAAGDGWEIESRDTPGNGLQTPSGLNGAPEPVASFVFIPSSRAVPINPPSGTDGLGSNPKVQIGVSNVVGSPVSVVLYGREAPTPFPGPDFCLAVLPDTQYYSAERFGGSKNMFAAQTEWAITNKEANVAYVAQLGDISDSGDIKGTGSNLTEWRNVTNAVYRLENKDRTQKANGMPYGLAVGNHDQEPNGDPTGTTLFYNQYFGINHFLGRSYYGGHYGTNNDNHFDLFSASGLDFIVLYFEYDANANTDVLAWANDVLRTNSSRRAIAVTHYMGSPRTPSTHSAQGAAIYNALKTNRNLFMLLGGHVSGEGSRVDEYQGSIVRTFITDYQSYTNGGNGFMRLMFFSPSNNVVTAQTYSPWTGEYETDDDSEFFFSYNMQLPGGYGSPGTPWTTLTNFSAEAGQVAGFTWSGLKANRTFEWYATFTDRFGNTATTSPEWFTTGPNAAPIASNVAVRITGDTPAQLQLVASDPNSDDLTFRNITFPANGIIGNFDTNAGVVTYIPVRNFRGGDRFTYQANDGIANSGAATMNITVEAPTDSNTNGLPDNWESTFGVSNPDADPDGDGESNLAEYKANTNPTNAASVLKVSHIFRRNDGNLDISWNSVGGTRYRVLYSDFMDTGFSSTFNEVVRGIALELDQSPYGMESTQHYTDSTAATNNHGRSYRIKVVP